MSPIGVFQTPSDNLSYGSDGSVRHVMSERIDAIEFSQAYESVIAGIESQIRARMKQEGIHGPGSCHAYLGMKEDLLKEHGIPWRSPAQLNSHICYD